LTNYIFTNFTKEFSFNEMRSQIAFSSSEDRGRYLENLVFLELKRNGKVIYSFKNKSECDFLVLEKTKAQSSIQVTLTIEEENRERELKGLLEAMDMFQIKEGFIITNSKKS
jgi:uncharacterized protein